VIPFHRVLIATAILFCGGFSLWALAAYVDDHRAGMLALTLVFGVLGVTLAYYLRNLKRFLGR
jgi:hypothetical protein